MQRFNQSVETLPRAFGNGVSRTSLQIKIDRSSSFSLVRRRCLLRLIRMQICMPLYIKLVQTNIIIILRHHRLFRPIGIHSVAIRRHPTRGSNNFFSLSLVLSDQIEWLLMHSFGLFSFLSYETIYSNKSANDEWFLQTWIFVQFRLQLHVFFRC